MSDPEFCLGDPDTTGPLQPTSLPVVLRQREESAGRVGVQCEVTGI